MQQRSLFVVMLIAAAVSLVCSRSENQSVAPAVARGSGGAARVVSREVQILSAEQRADSSAVRREDLMSRRVEIRRVAARALARIGDEHALSMLEKALADEDAAVVSWAAHGWGLACESAPDRAVKRLVARAASLIAEEGDSSPESMELMPLDAIANALARCATPTAERTLRVWLSGPKARAESAALALGLLASHRQGLEEASLVALLNGAGDGERPLDNALLALSRMGSFTPPLRQRLHEVAVASLRSKGKRRALAIRALGRAGEPALKDLEGVASDDHATPSERADAVRELARLADAGQEALGRVLSRLARPVLQRGLGLDGTLWAPLIAVIKALEPPAGATRSTLEDLARLPVDGKRGPERLRLIRLRCRSASLLAGQDRTNRLLRSCDPGGGREGKLVLLAVMDRRRIAGESHREWLSLVRDDDPRVRGLALELVAGHHEISDAPQLLAEALASNDPGAVATAARILAARPDRGGMGAAAIGSETSKRGALHPQSAVIRALEQAFARDLPPDAVGVRAALIDAAGALQLLGVKARLESFCVSSNTTLRDHAHRALSLLGGTYAPCDAPQPRSSAPPEVSRVLSDPVTLRYETDLGELSMTLDPKLSPVSVTRIVELARRGFYDQMAIHRVVPGFIVQFGDPRGDGYGGAGRAPIRDESSPVGFERYSVGLALSGPDTGSSQLFVTVGPFPHLNGEFPLLGRASPGWEKLAEGDVIRKVRVEE